MLKNYIDLWSVEQAYSLQKKDEKDMRQYQN